MHSPLKPLLLSMVGLFAMEAHAQSSPRPFEMCPDWTATDIHGDTHNLYSLLDSGYTVIMDFSTTWCPPCIQYHQSHTLRNLYLNYGPGTAQNKVRVFLVECDPATDMDDLLGVGGQGTLNWVNGTPYPIIDDADLADQFNVVAYPTILTICPSRMVSSISWPYGVANMWAQSQVCAHHFADSPHDATLLGKFQDHPCRAEGEPLFTRIYNVGTEPLTEVAIEAVDPATEQVVSATTWTGHLPTYTAADVYLPAWTPAPGDHAVRFRIVTPDDDPANDSLANAPFRQESPSSPTVDITVELLTDDGGTQIGWRLGQESSTGLINILPGSLANNTLYTYSFTLPAGACHKIDLYDTGGDGLQAPGYFAVKSNGTTFLAPEHFALTASGSIHFLRAYFRADPTMSVASTEAAAFEVYPNPSGHTVFLSGPAIGSTVRLLDALGRSVLQERITAEPHGLSVAGLPAGMYLLHVQDGAQVRTVRVQVMR